MCLAAGSRLPAEVPVEPDGEEARGLVIEELGKAPYQQAKPTLIDQLQEAFWAWFTDLLTGLEGANTSIGIAAIIIGAAAIAGIALWLARPRLNPSGQTAARPLFEDDPRLSAEQHRMLASQAAARNDWAAALTEQFRAIVRSAEERLILEPGPGQTADEAVAALRAAFPEQDRTLSTLGLRFDEVLYGGATARAADYSLAEDVDRDLRRTAPVGRPRAGTRWTVPA